uniref:Uncharacterized protein n=1 Tax=Glossina pallidipes TaxID=7398 RepID=A0A1A9ZCA4_GLOPL
MVNKKQAQTALENIIKGRRLTLAIKTGPKNEVAKFKQPAPKLAHSASVRSDVPKIFRKLNTWPTTTPPVTPTAQNTPKAPRKAKGAISVKYIGKVAVVKPEAKPTNKRPNINISTELAIRQKENIIPPIINNKPLMRKHPFLYTCTVLAILESLRVVSIPKPSLSITFENAVNSGGMEWNWWYFEKALLTVESPELINV